VGTVLAEVLAPEPVGPSFVVHHEPIYHGDGEREVQAVAAARLAKVGGRHLVRGRRIGYVLVRGRSQGPTLQVRPCERVFVDPVDGVQESDHHGVLAELVLPGRPPGSQDEPT
jgi:hypothetical protein